MAISLIYATRAGFWVPVILGLVLIGAALLVVRQIREKSFMTGNDLSMITVLIFSIASLAITEEFVGPRNSRVSTPAPASLAQNNATSAPIIPDQTTNQDASIRERNDQATASQSPVPPADQAGPAALPSRFLFLSTHHHSMSGDPLTHQRCLEFLRGRHAHIIAAHNVTESYSGYGLIVASFDDQIARFLKLKSAETIPPIVYSVNWSTISRKDSKS